MLKLQYFLFLLIIFFIHCHVENIKEGEGGLYCGERILDDSNYLSETARNNLCSMIRDNRYLIVIKGRLKDPSYPEATEEEFTRDTEALFNERCRFFSNMCDDGVLIGIYVKDMRIRIQAGERAKEHLSISAREKIITSVKNLLVIQNFGGALESMVGSIRNFFISSESTSTADMIRQKYWETTEGIKNRYERIKQSIRETYQDTKEGIKDKYHTAKEGVRDKYYDVKEGVKERLNEYTRTSEEDYETTSFGRIFFIMFAFILVGAMCLNLYNKAAASKVFKVEKIDLHVYVKFLISLLQDIRKSNDRTILTNHCLLCAKNFEQYDPLAYKEGKQDETLKFGCGHLYHRGCLERLNRFKCLTCIENMNTTSYEKSTADNRHYISEVDLMRFLDNLRLLYSQQEFDDFYNNYPESRASFENNFHINMNNKYGCTDFSKGKGGVQYPSFDKDKERTAEGSWEQSRATAATSGGNTAAGGFDEPRPHG